MQHLLQRANGYVVGEVFGPEPFIAKVALAMTNFSPYHFDYVDYEEGKDGSGNYKTA